MALTSVTCKQVNLLELVVSWEKHMECKEEVQSSGSGGALQEEQLESIL